MVGWSRPLWRCKQLKRLWAVWLGATLGLAPLGAAATPDPGAVVHDALFWAAPDRFVVLRNTYLHYGSYYQAALKTERVEISVWDGRVVARCRIGLQEAKDSTAEGNWTYTVTGPEPGCDMAPASDMVTPITLFEQGYRSVFEAGEVRIEGASQALGTVAEQDFVSQRLGRMTAAERQACADQPAEWPRFGGCFLNQDMSLCAIEGSARATADRIFVPIRCGEQDGSTTWLAIGRAFWEAKTP